MFFTKLKKDISVENVRKCVEKKLASGCTLEEIFELRNEQDLNVLSFCCCYGEENTVKVSAFHFKKH